MKLHPNKRTLLPAMVRSSRCPSSVRAGSTAGSVFQAPTTPVETPTSTATTATTAAPPAVAGPTTCTVPNVVGMVHQYAQDTKQAAGLYVLQEKDATGRGPMLVLDRNWETTAQSVAAGQVVECTTVITLSAKKIGE